MTICNPQEHSKDYASALRGEVVLFRARRLALALFENRPGGRSGTLLKMRNGQCGGHNF
jgi:hypothetical protein